MKKSELRQIIREELKMITETEEDDFFVTADAQGFVTRALTSKRKPAKVITVDGKEYRYNKNNNKFISVTDNNPLRRSDIIKGNTVKKK